MAATKASALSRVYSRLASGLLGWTRRIWTHASHGDPLVVEAIIRVFESKAAAERVWRSIPKNRDFYQLIPDNVSVSQPDPGEMVIEWRHDELRFIEISRLVHSAVISYLSSGYSNQGAPSLLRTLHEQTAANLPSPGATRVPLFVRQLALGGAIGLGIAGVADFAVDRLIEGAGVMFALAALGLLVSCFIVRRVRRRARVRLALRYGDTDGHFRKALSSVGVALP